MLPLTTPAVTSDTSLFAASCTLYASVVVHIVEWSSSFSYELENIWCKRGRLSPFQFLHLSNRYLAVLTYIGHFAFQRWFLPAMTLPVKTCVITISSGCFVIEVMMFSIKFCSLHYLFRIYNRYSHFLVPSIILVGVETFLFFLWEVKNHTDIQWYGGCAVRTIPPSWPYMAAFRGLFQVLVWGMILKSGNFKGMSAMLRRTMDFFLVLVALFLPAVAIPTYQHVDLVEFQYCVLPPLVTLLSAFNCRMLTDLDSKPPSSVGSANELDVELVPPLNHGSVNRSSLHTSNGDGHEEQPLVDGQAVSD